MMGVPSSHNDIDEKVSRMMKGAFDLSEVDQTDFDAVELAWNNWVRVLFAGGLRPSEQPLDESTPERLVYSLHPIGGLDDFNTRVQHGLLLKHVNLAGAVRVSSLEGAA